MAKLTILARKRLPDSAFALPGRLYPIEDRSHAANALSRVSANGTPEEKAKVRDAVHRRYPTIGRMDDGGQVPQWGPYDLQQGEIVIPNRMAPIVAGLRPILGGPGTQFAPRVAFPHSDFRDATQPDSSKMAIPNLRPIPPARTDEARMAPIPNFDPSSAPRYTPLGNDDGSSASGRATMAPIPYLPQRGDSQRQSAPLGANAIDSSNGASSSGSQTMAPVPGPQIGGPALDRLRQDYRQGFQAPKMSTKSRILRTVGAAVAGGFAGAAGRPEEGPQLGHEIIQGPTDRARQAWNQRIQNDTAAYNLEHQQQEDARAALPDYKFENVKGHLYALDPHTGEAVRDYGPSGTDAKVKEVQTDEQGNAVAVFDDGTTRSLGYKVQQKPEKPERFTSPFEAFAYGTPEEKQSAQDFLAFEKKNDAKYEKPGDVEQRYQLYKSDPDAYKAMFGDRGSSQDQAQASRMLNYFDRQKKQIEDDWTLDEQTKAQRLQEIEDLEQPYLDAAAPQGGPSGGGSAPSGDRVNVISPGGKPGTIPRSQLKSAQAKGYKLSQSQ